jgi:hypothetical protein
VVHVKHGSTNRRCVSEMIRVRLSVSLIALFGVMLVIILQSNGSASAAGSQQATKASVNGPTVTTGEQTRFFPQDTATINGTVEGSPGQATTDFEYGLSTAYGLTSETQDITIPTNGPLTVSAELTGLSIETTYHFRLAVTQDGTTYYGNDRQFMTHGAVPPAGVSGETATGPVPSPAQPPKTPGSSNTESQTNSPRVALLGVIWRRGRLVVTIRCLGLASQRCRGSGVLTEKKRPGSHPLAVARIQASVTGGQTVQIVAKRLTSSAKFNSLNAHTLALTFNTTQSSVVARPAT